MDYERRVGFRSSRRSVYFRESGFKRTKREDCIGRTHGKLSISSRILVFGSGISKLGKNSGNRSFDKRFSRRFQLDSRSTVRRKKGNGLEQHGMGSFFRGFTFSLDFQ